MHLRSVRTRRRARRAPGFFARLLRALSRVARGGLIALSTIGPFSPPPPPPPPPPLEETDDDGDPPP